jgi:ABC-type multidrug transport system fused ATPase/permease subunit
MQKQPGMSSSGEDMNLVLKHYFTLLNTYLKPQWQRSVILALLLLTNTALQLLNPQIMKTFIDTTRTQGLSRPLLLIALLFAAISLFKQVLDIADTYLGEYIAWTATNHLRRDLLQHCLSLDLAFHKAHSQGELIERIDGDVATLSTFFSGLVIQLGSNALLLLGIWGIFWHIDWRAGMGTSVYTLLCLGLLFAMRRRLIPLWRAQRQASASFYGFLGEHLDGAAEIRTNGAIAAIMRRILGQLRSWFTITLKTGLMTNQLTTVNFLLVAGGLLLTLILGVYLHELHPSIVTVGTIFAMYTYTFMLIGPIWTIQTHLQNLQQVEACIQRINELFSTTSSLQKGAGASLGHGPLSIEFRQVTFGYESSSPVLSHINFSLEPGKVLGIVGQTGSGKTTLARLIFRFYDLQAGSIRLDNVPVQDIDLQTLRQHMVFVTQDVQLFQASVRDNLTFFNAAIADKRLLQAIEDLGLSSWYQSLPEGLDTLLAAGNGSLSAGEAQLLALTRAFLQDPGIIILDEASSRLDPATAALLEKTMDKLIAGRTTIIIAHRLSTVQRADNILILDQGTVREYGSRELLMQDTSSQFSQLLHVGLEELPV